ncbi:thioesterase family protein [Crossiella sp. NPDC003009]
MGDFQSATAVTRRAGTQDFDVVLDQGWGLEDIPNGGYLLAVLGRAATELAGQAHPHVTAISGSFLQRGAPGPAVVTAEVLRAGRAATQVRARLSQDGLPRVEALVTLGRLSDEDPFWSASKPPALPPLAECPRSPVMDQRGGLRIHILEQVEQYLDPAGLGFLTGNPSGRAELAGWMRLADGSDWDPLSLVLAVDCLPPVTYDLGVYGWTPTVQLSAYLRALPAPGPIRLRAAAAELGNGHVDVTVAAWDSKDRLVAQGTQIASVRLPG